jgi:hypothetical protein
MVRWMNIGVVIVGWFVSAAAGFQNSYIVLYLIIVWRLLEYIPIASGLGLPSAPYARLGPVSRFTQAACQGGSLFPDRASRWYSDTKKRNTG